MAPALARAWGLTKQQELGKALDQAGEGVRRAEGWEGKIRDNSLLYEGQGQGGAV